jgi:hypothetical protein
VVSTPSLAEYGCYVCKGRGRGGRAPSVSVNFGDAKKSAGAVTEELKAL